MRYLLSIISIFLTIIGGLSLSFAETLDMIDFSGDPINLQYWGLVLFVIGVGLPTVVSELNNLFVPKIELVGFSADKVVYKSKFINIGSRKQRIPNNYIPVSLTIKNKSTRIKKSIDGVFPQITWYDSEGNIVSNNSGIWMVSSGNKENESFSQTVDLSPNNQPKTLHIAKVSYGKASIWFRTQDSKSTTQQLGSGDYHVVVELFSNSGSKKKFSFLLSFKDNNPSIKKLNVISKFLWEVQINNNGKNS